MWLSFADSERPDGEQFLGAVIVEIEDDEVEEAKADVEARAAQRKVKPLPGAEYMAAACRKAWLMGCNPGGECAGKLLPPLSAAQREMLPLYRLLSKADIAALDRAMEAI